MSGRHGNYANDANTVVTLRVMIAFSVMFVFMFVVNHSLMSTLSNESSKVFVQNSIEKFVVLEVVLSIATTINLKLLDRTKLYIIGS